jgi:hypothetical protein
MMEARQPTVSEVAEMTRQINKPNQVRNAAANFETIRQMYDKGRPDLSQVQIQPGTPMLVVGGGPSLDDILPTLWKWRGLIACTPQTYNSLIANRCVPSLVFAMDSSIEDVEPLQGEGDAWQTLVTHQCIHPEMLKAWKGQFAFMRVKFDDGSDDDYDIMYPQIRTAIGAQGCVANMMVIIGNLFKCNPIICAGVDFSHIETRTHATFYRKIGDFKYQPTEWPKDTTTNGRTPVNDFYAMLMLAIWKGTEVNLLSVSRGILEVPKISWEDACAGKFPPRMTREELYAAVDKITVPYGVYGQCANGQLNMIEFAQRLTETPKNDSERELGKLWHKDDKGKWHRDGAVAG